ncbi:hypothetical protein DFH09DRAFT_1313289 [Mycena vulgaris]|nr:hypothetical protein DFH09DRAFT_1313289 [Mycena vulgaris]
MPDDLDDAGAAPVKSEPDISIFGTGPCATKEASFLQTPSYSEAASLWEVRTDDTFGGSEKGQVGCYALEVFIQQPYRRFVYITLISCTIRILRFDRAGCYYSQRIKYHDGTVFFGKLVVLLSSFNEALLGYDTSVSWVDGKHVMKMTPAEIFNEGVWEANTTELVFELDNQLIFSRRTIRSRGTVCWTARYKGEYYIIKDYWCAEGRAQESAFLKDLAGIRGVGQMLTYDDDRDKVVTNRTFTRLVLVKYDQTLEKAKSARHLLCAVWDIVQVALSTRGSSIVISASTTSFPPMIRLAVVIDWDLAKRVNPKMATERSDGDATTHGPINRREYWMVPPYSGISDNMDDIESIFYVLYHVLFGYDASGNSLPAHALGTVAHWHDICTP